MHTGTTTKRTRSTARVTGAALATAALVGGLATPAHAASPVDRIQVSAESAIAQFVVIEECKRTRVEIFSNVSTELGSRSTDEIGLVAVSILNTCTNLSVVEGFGQTLDIDLAVDKSLANASLKMSLPLTNILNATTTTLTLDLRLAATSAPVTTVGRDRFVSEGTVFTFMAATTTRQAEATGSIVMGSEEIVGAGDVSAPASINKAKAFDSTRQGPA